MYIPAVEEEKLKKVKALEQAVLDCSPGEISEVYKKLGKVDFTARALGLACRFRGVDCVRALVEGGASFDTPAFDRDQQLYHAYSRKKRDFNHSDYSVYLLNIGKKISGSCCCKGMKFTKSVRLGGKETLKMLPDSERAEVLKYLCANRKKISFKPWELLLYAIFARDDFIFGELKKLGIKISDYRVKVIVEGGAAVNSYFREYRSMTDKLSAENYIPVMERLYGEVGGKFHCTEKIFESVKTRLADPIISDFFAEKFETDSLNKLKILRGAVDENNTSMLSLGERLGWLANTNRRDTLIEYAAEKGKTECTAWLLDFKNRTADFAAEREKAEKKIKRELNAGPDSVTMQKMFWSYKRLKDGTLRINLYKGNQTEIKVPKKIGRSIVTVIGERAFFAGNPKCDVARRAFFGTIKKVVLPDTITKIESSAFIRCRKLTEIDIPDSVAVIEEVVFGDCKSLEHIKLPSSLNGISGGMFTGCCNLREIIIPGSVKKIGSLAFDSCDKLKEIIIPDSVTEIGSGAFSFCGSLEYIRLPNGLQKITEKMLWHCEKLKSITIPGSVKSIDDYAFEGCNELSEIIIPNGVTYIGEKAFANCQKLKFVVLPDSVKYIESSMNSNFETETVFKGSDNVIAVVDRKSIAERYCSEFNIPYKYINIKE